MEGVLDLLRIHQKVMSSCHSKAEFNLEAFGITATLETTQLDHCLSVRSVVFHKMQVLIYSGALIQYKKIMFDNNLTFLI